MPITFRVAQRMDAPRDAVFAALTDLDRASDWMPGFVRIERLDGGGPLTVGSRWRETRRLFGREATEEFELTELAAPARIGMRVDGARGSSRRGEYLFTYHLAPATGATDVTLDGEIRGMGGVMELIGRLFVGTYRKACLKDLEALSRHLRERETAAPTA